MRRASLGAAGLVAGAILSAFFGCGRFSAEEPSDAGASEAGLVDAGLDAPASDAVAADATADATAAGECKGSVVFRDTFDRTGAAGGPALPLTEGSPLLDFDAGHPPPALLASAPALARDAGDAFSRIVRSNDPPASGVCVELDALVNGTPAGFGTDGWTEIVAIDATGAEHLYLQIDSSGMVLWLKEAIALQPAFPFGRWVHVSFRVTFGPNGTTEVKLDGTTAANVPTGSGTANAITTSVGVHSHGPSSAVTATIDNVVVAFP